MRANERMAQIVSAVFNPVLLSSVTFTLLILKHPVVRSDRKFVFVLIAVVFASIVPSAIVLVFKKKRLITTLDVEIKEQRLCPLILSIGSFLIGFGLLFRMGAPAIVSGLMFCYATNTALVLGITRYWKISVHATGLGSPLTALTFQFGNILLPWYALLPLIGTARVVLHKHTIAQVCAGSLVGLGCTAVQLGVIFV